MKIITRLVCNICGRVRGQHHAVWCYAPGAR